MAGTIAVTGARGAQHDHILETSLATADVAAALTASYLAEAEASAQELATRPVVRTAAQQGELASLSTELAHWSAGHPHIGNVGIVDLEGRHVASGQDLPSPPDGAAARDWFRGVLSTRAPFLGAPGRSSVTGRPRLPYGAPGHG